MPLVPADISRREFLELGAAAGLACATSAGCRTGVPAATTRGLAGPAIPPFALQEATIADLQAGMQSGKYTARGLCEYYLTRIDELDGRGPALHSIIETNPEALTTAEQLDSERRAKGPRGPLHGIPVLVKDNIATADRMATTAGSLALLGAKPPADAVIVGRLRAAGAVIIGKANLSEWANFRSSNSSSGWSARGGQCKDPYALDPKGLDGARIGIARTKLFGYHAATDAVINRAIDVLRRAGAVIVDPADISHLGEYDDAELTVLLYEFKADLNRYLAEFAPGAPVKTLQDVIAFNERNKEREMPYFGQELFVKAQDKGPLSDQAYRDALDKCRKLGRDEGLHATLDQQKLDAIVAPTGNPAWPIDLVNGDHFLGGSSTPAAVAGFPHVTVPAGYVFGLPVGLSFIGAPWSEGTLVKLAYAYEQATTLRQPPKFPATVRVSS